MKLSLCIVAGRRPELLARTLASFHEHLFQFNEIDRVRVNIDPIFGTLEDAEKCKEVVTDHFGSVALNSPEEPGFAKAVQWLWQDAPDGLVLHLEDDWICKERIDTEVVAAWMMTSVRSVQLLSATHGKKGMKEYSESRYRARYFGMRIGRRQIIPSFGTSPGFFPGEFIRKLAPHFNVALDPEKQMKPDLNPDLWHEISPFRVRLYKTHRNEPIIEDIGIPWRKERGIVKAVTKDARSVWSDRID